MLVLLLAGCAPHPVPTAPASHTPVVLPAQVLGHVSTYAWSPDGARLAVASSVGLLTLDAAATPVAWRATGATPIALAWSTDGALAWSDGRHAWVAAPDGALVEVDGPVDVAAESLAWDGTTLLGWGGAGVTAWRDGHVAWTHASPGAALLARSPASHRLVVPDATELVVLDASSGAAVRREPESGVVTALALADDGETLAVADDAGLRVGRVAYDGAVGALAFGPDGTLALGDATGSRLLRAGHLEPGPVGMGAFAFTWGPAGALVGLDSSESLRLGGRTWACSGGCGGPSTWPRPSPDLRHVAWIDDDAFHVDDTRLPLDTLDGEASPDGRTLLLHGRRADVLVHDGHSTLVPRVGVAGLTPLSPDGRLLLTASSFGAAPTVVATDTGAPVATLRLPGPAPSAFTWSPHGTWLVGTQGDRACLWRVATGEPGFCVNVPGPADVRWSADEAWFVVGFRAFTLVRVADRLTLEHDFGSEHYAFSPDSTRLFGMDCHAWTLPDLTPITRDCSSAEADPEDAPRGGRAVDFDGSWLVAVAGSRTFRVEGPVQTPGEAHARWSPGGTHLLSWQDDGPLRLWDPTTGTATVLVPHFQTRNLRWVDEGHFASDFDGFSVHTLDGRRTAWRIVGTEAVPFVY